MRAWKYERKQKRGRDDKEVMGGIKEQNQEGECKGEWKEDRKEFMEEKDCSRRVENNRKFGVEEIEKL